MGKHYLPQAYLKGFERLAYGAVVLKELKKTIRCFQDDIQQPRGDEAPKPLR